MYVQESTDSLRIRRAFIKKNGRRKYTQLLRLLSSGASLKGVQLKFGLSYQELTAFQSVKNTPQQQIGNCS